MGDNSIQVGVLAIQGAFIEHINKLKSIISQTETYKNIKVIEIRTKDDLDGTEGIILPGGESTTMSLVLQRGGLLDPLRNFVTERKVVWGTCAGLILLSNRIVGNTTYVEKLGGLDITTERNHYGRQVQSFSGPIHLKKHLLPHPQPQSQPLSQSTMFIRAPAILEVKDTVTVLATRDVDGDCKQEVVAVEQNNVIGTTFHPELTDNLEWHTYFLDLVVKNSFKRNMV